MSDTLRNCAGVIVFDQEGKTILVQSKKRQNLSFPKGKRQKDETNFQAALRELDEETGIKQDQIELIPSYQIEELSDKGNVNIVYYVGLLKTPIDKFIYDHEELSGVDWYQASQISNLEKLKDSRKHVFKQAYQAYQEYQNK